MTLRKTAVLIASVALMCGCSVKEDRDSCPCLTTVQFVGYTSEPLRARFFDAVSGEKTDEFNDIRYNLMGEMYLENVNVPRRQHRVDAWCMSEKSTIMQDRIVAMPGEEIDSVRTGSSPLDTRSETAYAVVKLNRQYCEIRVRLVGADAAYPYNFTVKGKVCGVTITDGRPVDGEFMYMPKVNGGRFTVNVPRQHQRDNTLTLTIKADTEVKAVLPLGEFIAKTGYDWEAESLVPVDITLDYANATVKVRVNDWGLGAVIENYQI